jgi:hypothetical protein
MIEKPCLGGAFSFETGLAVRAAEHPPRNP